MQRVRRALENRFGPPALLPFLAALTVGCHEELGPVVGRTTRVTGVVRIDRRPVGGGWVEFYPVAGTVGNLRVAPVGPDGRFTADGVAVGTNMVGLAQLPNAGPYRHQFRSYLSTIRRNIPAGPGTTLDLDLADEAAARATSPR